MSGVLNRQKAPCVVRKVLVSEAVRVIVADGRKITVRGRHGQLCLRVPRCLKVELRDKVFRLSSTQSSVHARSVLGTTCALLRNMMTGVAEKFVKTLKLVGLGYRCSTKDRVLTVSVGFSHPVEYSVPRGVSVECLNPREVRVSGVDKQLVGQTAATIRSYRRADPYKGKGIRYHDEIVRTKEIKKK